MTETDRDMVVVGLLVVTVILKAAYDIYTWMPKTRTKKKTNRRKR